MGDQKEVIDALNARTAAYDVEIERLNVVIAGLQHELSVITEQATTALADANKRSDDALTELREQAEKALNDAKTKHDAKLEDLRSQAKQAKQQSNETIQKLQSDNRRLRKTIADHLMETDDGKSAVTELRRIFLEGQLAATQAELEKL